LKNLGHRVARSTIATILRNHGVGPVPERPTSWRTFLATHWGAIAAADFFTTEVWTARGLVTYYTLFVIDLASRWVHLVGSTPQPDEAFVVQTARTLTHADNGALVGHRILICDRDTKWSEAFRRTLAAAGIRVVQTPPRAPDCNAYAERCVRSIREECLDRLVILGEAHLRRALREFAAHYHAARNHQGLHDELIAPALTGSPDGPLRCRPRLGGLLHYHYRADCPAEFSDSTTTTGTVWDAVPNSNRNDYVASVRLAR
jgi:transposase InsO family protein